MCATDAWHSFLLMTDEKVGVKDYVEQLAHDLIYNEFRESESSKVIGLCPGIVAPDEIAADQSMNPLSPLSCSISGGSTTSSSWDFAQQEHKFKTTLQPSANEVDKKGNPRPVRRFCLEEGCKRKVSWECTNPQCMQTIRKANRFETRGIFYCNDHQSSHWKAMCRAVTDSESSGQSNIS